MFNIILIILPSLVLQDPSAWIIHSDSLGQFTILFPDEVQTKEQMISTETGDIMLVSAYVKSHIDSTENFIYLINYHPVNEELYIPDSSHLNYEVLEMLITDLSENMHSKLLYTNQTFIDEFQAVEYRMQYGEKLDQVKGKMILTDSYLYSIQVYTRKQYSLNRNMDKFIDSFILTKN